MQIQKNNTRKTVLKIDEFIERLPKRITTDKTSGNLQKIVSKYFNSSCHCIATEHIYSLVYLHYKPIRWADISLQRKGFYIIASWMLLIGASRDILYKTNLKKRMLLSCEKSDIYNGKFECKTR